MISKLMRSTAATAGMAALLLLGACASNPSNDNPAVDDQAEVRPFTEQGYDPTLSAPELADANNDGHVDTSTTAPRKNGVATTMVVAENQEPRVTVTQESTLVTDSSSSTGSTTGTSGSTTGTSSSTWSADNSSSLNTGTSSSNSGTGTTTTTTTTTMTSSAQTNDDDDDDAAPVRTRLRKD